MEQKYDKHKVIRISKDAISRNNIHVLLPNAENFWTLLLSNVNAHSTRMEIVPESEQK